MVAVKENCQVRVRLMYVDKRLTEAECLQSHVEIALPSKPKRGKDIKVFEDLPPDVQATINRLSESNEEKAKRTQVAIKYQHLFPDRYYSTGI